MRIEFKQSIFYVHDDLECGEPLPETLRTQIGEHDYEE